MYHSVTNYIGNKRLICSGGDDAMQIQGKSWAVVESREALATYERLLRDILTKKTSSNALSGCNNWQSRWCNERYGCICLS